MCYDIGTVKEVKLSEEISYKNWINKERVAILYIRGSVNGVILCRRGKQLE
jgi:hypothetical protein